MTHEENQLFDVNKQQILFIEKLHTGVTAILEYAFKSQLEFYQRENNSLRDRVDYLQMMNEELNKQIMHSQSQPPKEKV